MLVENQSSKGIALAVQEVLPQAKVYILDPQNDGVHLEAIVIAKEFETLSLLQQHNDTPGLHLDTLHFLV